MNGHYHVDDDDEDDDQEMVRLISKSDHVVQCHNPHKASKKKRKTVCPNMKPLEVMHSSARRRLFNAKPSTMACRVGATVMSLSLAIGLWIWSGRNVTENTGILRWNSLKVRDIHYWCLDVSGGQGNLGTLIRSCTHIAPFFFFFGRNPTIASATTPWNQNIERDTKRGKRHTRAMFATP